MKCRAQAAYLAVSEQGFRGLTGMHAARPSVAQLRDFASKLLHWSEPQMRTIAGILHHSVLQLSECETILAPEFLDIL